MLNPAAPQAPAADNVVAASAQNAPVDEPPSYSGLYDEPPPLYYPGELPPAYQVSNA